MFHRSSPYIVFAAKRTRVHFFSKAVNSFAVSPSLRRRRQLSPVKFPSATQAKYHLANETSKAVTKSRKWQSRTRRLSRKTGHFWTFDSKSLYQMQGVVYTKSVKESEEIIYISLQSSKRSFRKMQIFKFAYSALTLFYSLFRLKSSLHRVVYTKSVKESEEISCISLQSSKRWRFAKYRFLNLHILHFRCFVPC